MNILVTSGGTKEQIDSVRSITNHASGRLGAKIADAFAQFPQVKRIVYVCGEYSILPKTDKAEIYHIRGTLDLEDTLQKLTRQIHFDSIIHNMAVSDYRVKAVTTVSAMANAAAACHSRDEMAHAIAYADPLGQGGKISSSVPDMAILLERTPKVISLLRDLSPDAVIVGFKLLDHVSHEQLMDTAYKLLVKNDCDYVLANDMKTVKSNCHYGFLMDRNRSEVSCAGKDAIASTIARIVVGRVEER